MQNENNTIVIEEAGATGKSLLIQMTDSKIIQHFDILEIQKGINEYMQKGYIVKGGLIVYDKKLAVLMLKDS